MSAADGQFDSTVEKLLATVDTSGLTTGRHTLFVESLLADGTYGVPTAIFLDVVETPDGNSVAGTEIGDRLEGTEASDLLEGLGGNDFIAGGLGNDFIFGGGGEDLLRGDLNSSDPQNDSDGGDDVLYGGAGRDWLEGKGGNDLLYGGEGYDEIFGDKGDDVIYGGREGDRLTGGEGSDTFVLAAGEGTDTILDFELGIDFIGLSGGLSFGQLEIIQAGKDTAIKLAHQTLAQLSDITASDLGAEQFIPV